MAQAAKRRAGSKPEAKRVNRSELIRQTAQQLGKDSRPRDVIAALRQAGVKVSPALVTNVLGKRPARTSKAKGKSTASPPAKGRAVANSGAASRNGTTIRAAAAARAAESKIATSRGGAGNDELFSVATLRDAKILVKRAGSFDKARKALAALAELM